MTLPSTTDGPRDLARFQWKADFHKAVWTRLKQSHSQFPDWTFEQLTANGWKIKQSNRRGGIDLYHDDGTSVTFIPTIEEQIMPHVAAMMCRLCGFSMQYVRDNLETVKAYCEQQFPNLTFTIDHERKRIVVNNEENVDKTTVFTMVHDVPLDESYPHPDMTTSKKYVLDILGNRQIYLGVI